MLGTAAEAAYHRGDHAPAERLARAGLQQAADDGLKWYCRYPLSVVALARGAHADCVEHALAAAAGGPGPRDSFGIAALALAYSGDVDAARTLNDRGLREAASPSDQSSSVRRQACSTAGAAVDWSTVADQLASRCSFSSAGVPGSAL